MRLVPVLATVVMLAAPPARAMQAGAAQKPAPPPAPAAQKPAPPQTPPAAAQKPAPAAEKPAPPQAPPAPTPTAQNPLPTENYTYDPSGRRDPFLNLLGTGSEPRINSRRGEGPA